MLKRAGYEVKTAPGPREAMDIVRAESPALILMDMNFTPVSYTHLDVYKRQVHENLRRTYPTEYPAFETLLFGTR